MALSEAEELELLELEEEEARTKQQPQEQQTQQPKKQRTFFDPTGEPGSAGPKEILGSLLQGVGMAVPNPAAAGAMFMGGQAMQDPNKSAGGVALQAGMGAAGGAVLSKAGQGIKALKGLMKWENASQQAVKAEQAVDAVEKTFGDYVNVSIKQSANKPTNLSIPSNIVSHVEKAISEPVFGVLRNQDGSIVQTVENLNRMKTAISQYSKTGSFQKETVKDVSTKLQQFYGDIKEEMIKAAKDPDLENSLNTYHDFKEKATLIRKNLLDEQGNAEANKLKIAFKFGSRDNLKKAWDTLSKYSPEMKEIMGSMKRREILTNLLKIGGVAGAGTASVEGIRRTINR